MTQFEGYSFVEKKLYCYFQKTISLKNSKSFLKKPFTSFVVKIFPKSEERFDINVHFRLKGKPVYIGEIDSPMFFENLEMYTKEPQKIRKLIVENI